MSSYKIIFGLVAVAVVANAGMANGQQSSSRKPLSSQPNLSAYNKAPDAAQVRYEHSEVKLLAGSYKNGEWLAGVEIFLAPGWKTYWRVPGDAGVPAEFVWKDSTNLANAQVMWPAPKRYQDITGKSIGYKKQVVFPVKIKAAQKDKPVDVDLRLYYAVCSDICVPAQASLALRLEPKTGDFTAKKLIDKFVEKVPSKNAKGVVVDAVKIVSLKGKAMLEVALKGTADRATDILVEGFEDAYFDKPELVDQKGDSHIFHLPVDGLEDIRKLRGKKLKLTVLSKKIRLVSEQSVE